MPSAYWASLGPASAGSGTPNALVTAPAADALGAAPLAATDGAVEAAVDGAVEVVAGAQASSTAGAAIRPPTTTAERPMNDRRVSFDFSI